MKKLKDRYKRFKQWEQQPHQVAPLSDDWHECATCGTRYEGNYCPRCGQSAKIGRYSFMNAFLLYLDVWGLGNRGMFRTLRDLILRPGYMIRDYLRGMQMAYFPPFKMYFLLFTLSLLVDSGLNIQGVNRLDKTEEESVENVQKETASQETIDRSKIKSLSHEKKKEFAKEELKRIVDSFFEWCDNHSSLVLLVLVLLFSCPLWVLFRHSPSLPDIRLSECFVAMVYISNMLLIYNIVPSFLCFSDRAESIYKVLILLLAIIPIKQLSGFSYWSTIWRVPTAAAVFLAVLLLLFVTISLSYVFVVVIYL